MLRGEHEDNRSEWGVLPYYFERVTEFICCDVQKESMMCLISFAYYK